MDKTDRLRDYGLAFLLYEQGLGVCGYELIRELFIFVKLILNSYLVVLIKKGGHHLTAFTFITFLTYPSAGTASTFCKAPTPLKDAEHVAICPLSLFKDKEVSIISPL